MSKTVPRSHRRPTRTAAPKSATQLLERRALERIFSIHQRLGCKETCNAVSLAPEFGVKPLTIKRDIALMRDRMHMPIEWDHLRKTYYYTGDCSALPLLILTPHEALAFAMIGRRFSAQGQSPFYAGANMPR